jgi:hypothetical protein
MADVEASVTSASGADGSGFARSVAPEKLALRHSKFLWSSDVQMLGWESLIWGRRGHHIVMPGVLPRGGTNFL